MTSEEQGQRPKLHFDGSDDEDDTATKHLNDEKSHTFRQRRLTYTSHQVNALAAQVEDDEGSNEDESGTKSGGDSKKRELSADGNDLKRARLHDDKKEEGSKDSEEKNLVSIVLHASAPPVPSCPRRQSQLLYQHPPNENDFASQLENEENVENAEEPVETENKSDEVPDWMRVYRVRHESDKESDVDLLKLPFPRNVVGTYSCHGIEPVYDCDAIPFGANQDDTLTAIAKINQDRGGIAFPYANCPRTAVFAAYDGHGEGGELVAQFALHEIPKRLEKNEAFKADDIEKAFKEVFVQVNADLEGEADIEPLYSGCTACVALVRGNEIYLSNAGDSRAVMAQKKKKGGSDEVEHVALDLTVDQNPDSPGEKERIEKCGGFVSPPPEEGLSSRVWLDAGFSQIGLAMARSIGDYAVKTVGVIAEPVVTKHDIVDSDEFMIIATDGVWEFLSSQDAVDIVSEGLAKGDGSSLACQHLIEAAAAKWHEHEGDYRDDITALVIQMKDLWDICR